MLVQIIAIPAILTHLSPPTQSILVYSYNISFFLLILFAHSPNGKFPTLVSNHSVVNLLPQTLSSRYIISPLVPLQWVLPHSNKYVLKFMRVKDLALFHPSSAKTHNLTTSHSNVTQSR